MPGGASSGPSAGGSPSVCLGVIVGAHGVRGQVRIKPFTEDPADIAAYGPVNDKAGTQRFEVQVTGLSKGVVLARLSGVGNRTAAEALKGMELFVPREALPEVEEEVFYHADLLGLAVEDGEGRALGRVQAVHNFGAGDVLEVQLPEGGERLVPFTKAAVPIVDIAGGRLVVDPPAEVGGPEPSGPLEGDGA